LDGLGDLVLGRYIEQSLNVQLVTDIVPVLQGIQGVRRSVVDVVLVSDLVRVE
jgi:hypothetical protein